MRQEDTAMAGGDAVSDDGIYAGESVLEENYNSWREVWDLDDMSPRAIYEVGFRHGYEAGRKATK